ncbi:hypothetical protein RchiOBHm_Chr6g0244801 [Rosa chinensis]|uniref:Uncharacterized protein n=1 Tax=Rosa chinensis TaxID=74649 RepID=A0A2P6PJ42_ROSCH|nr:hypothetical protein RchiOBHm_Chr6g0244801 [Rosa chinensis]
MILINDEKIWSFELALIGLPFRLEIKETGSKNRESKIYGSTSNGKLVEDCLISFVFCRS